MVIERQNTIVITFVERDAPRPSAYDIHEWIHDTLRLPYEEIAALQLNGITRQIYIKCKTATTVDTIIRDTNGESFFVHEGGHRSRLTIDSAGMGIRYIKVYNLPTEVPNHNIGLHLEPYGHVLDIIDDVWSGQFRYAVPNGVRTVKIALKKHIPSYQDIAGHRVLITYAGQPITCALCHVTGHLRADCPKQRKRTSDTPTWTPLAHRPLIQPRTSLSPVDQDNFPPLPVAPTTTTLMATDPDVPTAANVMPVTSDNPDQVNPMAGPSDSATTDNLMDSTPEVPADVVSAADGIDGSVPSSPVPSTVTPFSPDLARVDPATCPAFGLAPGTLSSPDHDGSSSESTVTCDSENEEALPHDGTGPFPPKTGVPASSITPLTPDNHMDLDSASLLAGVVVRPYRKRSTSPSNDHEARKKVEKNARNTQ